jgi:catechol 2,3-dioxygenase-like lactoylglutathione lyase family enzyme
MIKGVRHVGLVVSDLPKALNFWCELMGFVVVSMMEECGPHIDAMMGLKDIRVTTAKLTAPDSNLLELLCFHSHPDNPTWEGKPYSTGFTHIALTVSNMDEIYQRLQKNGVIFPAEPQFSPDGKVKVIYAKGPENVLIELVELIE